MAHVPSIHRNYLNIRCIYLCVQGSDVVAITNYLDVGLQVATDYASANGDSPPVNGAALGVAWQVKHEGGFGYRVVNMCHL